MIGSVVTSYPPIEKVLMSIAITVPPTKATYIEGEMLDLSGMVVTATYTTGTEDVTSSILTSPVDGTVLTVSDNTITISYTYSGITKTTTQYITVQEKTLTSIAITVPPTKVTYTEGEVLNLAGMVVTATYSNGSTNDVTSSISTSPVNGATLTASDNTITISYTYSGITKTTTQYITVQELRNTYTVTATASGYSYGFEQCNNTSDTYYFSGLSKYDSNWWRSKNYHVSSSIAGCIVTLDIKKNAHVTIDVVDYRNQTYYDYGTVYALNSSSSKWTGIGNHKSGGETIDFGTVSVGTHTIKIEYQKNRSTNNDNDRLYFRVNIS